LFNTLCLSCASNRSHHVCSNTSGKMRQLWSNDDECIRANVMTEFFVKNLRPVASNLNVMCASAGTMTK
jgi:hypothetical protein